MMTKLFNKYFPEISAVDFFKSLLFAVISYFVFLFPVIRADFFYTGDDYVRADGLIRPWARLGRFLADYIEHLTTVSFVHQDIAPLPQILSILLLSLSSLFIVYILTKTVKKSYVFLTLPLGISPWFLQNFSYRFDSQFFCWSVLFSVIPFLFWSRKKLFLLISAISVVIIYALYQASISIFAMLFLYLFWQDFILKKEPFKKQVLFLLSSVFSLLTITLIYMKILRAVTDNLYTIKRSSFCELSTCWELGYTNSVTFLKNYLISPWVDTKIGFWVILVFLLSVVSSFFYFLKNKKRSSLFLLLYPLILLLMFACVFLWTVFFTKIVWAPRILTGMGAFLGICFLLGVKNQPFKKFLIPCSFTAIFLMGLFAVNYGNLLRIQRLYEREKLTAAQMVLNKISAKNIIFEWSPRAALVLNSYNYYSFLPKLMLMPPLYYANFHFGTNYKKCKKETFKNKRIFTSPEFSVSGDKNCYNIDFTRSKTWY